ncbi:MAG: hypothetical protein LLF94_02045 [Chlamydiales bacterium]|nr:hypothetical protein [Chlamydiales bacterium]
MTKITNSNDLNNYYNNVVSTEDGKAKKNKTRLIILKDKDGNEYLATKKLTLTERIGALFGGKASFSRIVEFCNQKNMHSVGLAKLVGKYNQSHTDKQIKYLFPLIWLKKEINASGNKTAQDILVLKGRDLMTAYDKVLNDTTKAALLRDYPEFNPQ